MDLKFLIVSFSSVRIFKKHNAQSQSIWK